MAAGTDARITGAQVRAARGVLRWSISDLADKAGVVVSPLQLIEKADGEPGADAAGLAPTRDYRESAGGIDRKGFKRPSSLAPVRHFSGAGLSVPARHCGTLNG
jgi:hypothetical protein